MRDDYVKKLSWTMSMDAPQLPEHVARNFRTIKLRIIECAFSVRH